MSLLSVLETFIGDGGVGGCSVVGNRIYQVLY